MREKEKVSPGEGSELNTGSETNATAMGTEATQNLFDTSNFPYY